MWFDVRCEKKDVDVEFAPFFKWNYYDSSHHSSNNYNYNDDDDDDALIRYVYHDEIVVLKNGEQHFRHRENSHACAAHRERHADIHKIRRFHDIFRDGEKSVRCLSVHTDFTEHKIHN